MPIMSTDIKDGYHVFVWDGIQVLPLRVCMCVGVGMSIHICMYLCVGGELWSVSVCLCMCVSALVRYHV